jgi:hypothetical protein
MKILIVNMYDIFVKAYEILHYTNDDPRVTIVGDLIDINTLPLCDPIEFDAIMEIEYIWR